MTYKCVDTKIVNYTSVLMLSPASCVMFSIIHNVTKKKTLLNTLVF